MIDIQLLRRDSRTVAAALATRGYDLDTQAFDALEARRKAVQLQAESLQAN
ncbi:MAG: serine--tRNA ligase, partial [Proteobacteria bacterium]|nr:serine--tRNA ligase [Pseudomonadota bacterium]